MKQVLLFLASAAATVGSCAPTHRLASHASNETSLRAVNAEYDRALIAADTDALNGIYTEDYSFVGDRAELRNKREQIRYMTNGSLRLLSAASDEIAVTILGPDHALVTGRFRTGAQEADFIERYTSVWLRQGSRWRLRHEHSSLDPRQGG